MKKEYQAVINNTTQLCNYFFIFVTLIHQG